MEGMDGWEGCDGNYEVGAYAWNGCIIGNSSEAGYPASVE